MSKKYLDYIKTQLIDCHKTYSGFIIIGMTSIWITQDVIKTWRICLNIKDIFSWPSTEEDININGRPTPTQEA